MAEIVDDKTRLVWPPLTGTPTVSYTDTRRDDNARAAMQAILTQAVAFWIKESGPRDALPKLTAEVSELAYRMADAMEHARAPKAE